MYVCLIYISLAFSMTDDHCLFLQVWKAQLVLSEFVLHKICTSSDFHGIVCLELGAGTGGPFIISHT